jgi:hypothetical protein
MFKRARDFVVLPQPPAGAGRLMHWMFRHPMLFFLWMFFGIIVLQVVFKL